uniref:Serine/threonine-protein phosphatase 1 regulatory subunit 10-like n=1 Tax=Callorhinchus milii TaxID=7868 RepID=A0A4W3H5L9_CALMI
MKESRKLVSRCTYLNIILQTRSEDILNRFIAVGGYKLLNSWLGYSKTNNNLPLLQQILLALQLLPLTVDHLKQNNTAKIVKQLSKTCDDEGLRKLAHVLVNHWMTVIRSQSTGAGVPPEKPVEKKRRKEERKEEGKVRAPVSERVPEPKCDLRPEPKLEDVLEKKREKPKSQRTTAPSHAKFRSTGACEKVARACARARARECAFVACVCARLGGLLKDLPPRCCSTRGASFSPPPCLSLSLSLTPLFLSLSLSLTPSLSLSLCPSFLSSPHSPMANSLSLAPVEKKYKPLNMTPNSTKEIKVKLIPPQRESLLPHPHPQHPSTGHCTTSHCFLLLLLLLRSGTLSTSGGRLKALCGPSL